MKSIQTKFVIIILSGILLSSFLIGSAGIFSSQKLVSKDSAMIMNLLCSEETKEIDNLLGRIEQSVDIIAKNAQEQVDMERISEEGYRDYYTNEIEKFFVNAANNTDGAIAVYLRLNPELTTPTAGLFWSKTEADGTLQKSEVTDFSKYDKTDIERVGWYYIPVETGEPTWMSPYFNKNINVYMISYVVPIYKENQLIGIVGMDIDFELMMNKVKKISVYDTGSAFLVDKDNNVIYYNESEKDELLHPSDINLWSVAGELGKKTSGNSLFTYKYKNVENRMAFRTLINGMHLIITAPSKEMDEDKNNLIFTIIVTSLTVTVFFIFVTIMNTGKIIKPLREINETAKRIAEGDLTVALDYKSKDEIGTLTESLKQMVLHLQKYMDDIHSLAYQDTMTGVNNKTAYRDEVNRLEEQIHLDHAEFAVIVFDINGLKQVNDKYGHDCGDILIINACDLISKIFGKRSVYRIGGDEFVAIIENMDYNDSKKLLDEFAYAIEEHNNGCSKEFQNISIASGIAMYDKETDMTFMNVFKRADKLMYKNKAKIKKGEEMV